jgi:hypothetical protein
LKLSSKELIVAEIITRLKIRKSVVSRGRHYLKEPGVTWQRLESRNWSRGDIASVESKPRTAGLLRKGPTALGVISTTLGKQLERVLPELATALPESHLKSLADRRKRDHALLLLA